MEHDPVEYAVYELWSSINRLSEVLRSNPAPADNEQRIILESQKNLFRIVQSLEQKKAA